MAKCPDCYGETLLGKGDGKCAECAGTGKISPEPEGLGQVRCANCGGTGKCPSCFGDGEV